MHLPETRKIQLLALIFPPLNLTEDTKEMRRYPKHSGALLILRDGPVRRLLDTQRGINNGRWVEHRRASTLHGDLMSESAARHTLFAS